MSIPSELYLKDSQIEYAKEHPEKECPECKKSLPRTSDYFYVVIENVDGLKGKCKECCRKYDRDRVKRIWGEASGNYVDNDKFYKSKRGMRKCDLCKSSWPLNMFTSDREKVCNVCSGLWLYGVMYQSILMAIPISGKKMIWRGL